MMTREYPPEIYGGAGVHVTELVAQLTRLCDVEVHCMGEPREGAIVHRPDPALAGSNPALTMLSAQLRMAQAAGAADVVHSHTWYTGLAGHLAAAFAIRSSADKVVSAALAPFSAGSGSWTCAVSRGAPMQWISTSHSAFSCAASSVTCTPAPP